MNKEHIEKVNRTQLNQTCRVRSLDDFSMINRAHRTSYIIAHEYYIIFACLHLISIYTSKLQKISVNIFHVTSCRTKKIDILHMRDTYIKFNIDYDAN